MEKKYSIEIDPRIQKLLGPNLYTNIYYVLAELIANAYDAYAHDVYIISDDDEIRLEDNRHGMSYINGEISKYLGVAKQSRSNDQDSYTLLGCKKIERRGFGKLAALSVSKNVDVLTMFTLENYMALLTEKMMMIKDSLLTKNFNIINN